MLDKIKESFSWKKIKSNKKIPLVYSIIFGFILSSFILIIIGTNPFSLMGKIMDKSFRNTRALVQFIQEFSLYLLLGIASFFSIKVGFFNLGAPGQIIFSGMIATLFALHTNSLPGALHVILTTLIAILSAIVYILLAALIKIFLGINDIVATILLNWIALEMLKAIYFNTSAFSDNPQRIDTSTPDIPNTADWIINSIKMDDLAFTVTIFISIIVLMSLWLVFKYTKIGYKINVTGKNERASYIVGNNTKKITLISVLISGAVIGLFVMGWYFGKNTSMSDIQNSSPSAMGFNGIIVYIIGGESMMGMILSSLLITLLQGPGSENLIGIPANISQIFIAVIIYTVAISKVFENWYNIKDWMVKKYKWFIDKVVRRKKVKNV